ncbi:unnamed protein product [Symbiodinium sp. CCMP2592]|nr:unnamed protein product [Symbiodinium sp. CCMP2592]
MTNRLAPLLQMHPVEVASSELTAALCNIIHELKRAKKEESLAEQAAVLLDLSNALHELRQSLCTTLHSIRLPTLVEPVMQATHLQALAAEKVPNNLRLYISCTLAAFSGKVVAQIYVKRNQPWLEAVPFGRLCHKWRVKQFQLLHEGQVVFPRARLHAMVPEKGEALELQVLVGQEAHPSIRVVVGRTPPEFEESGLPMPSFPLYEMCELQTPVLGDTNRLLFGDLLLRKPHGHISARLLDRFSHMVQTVPALGRRHLNEFKENLQATDHILHIRVSADGQSLALRAKLAYDPRYILVPVLESETKPPWNKKEFANVCNAIHSAVW